MAALYDLQWARPEVSLYDSPSSGKKVARSFLLAATHAELHSVTEAMRVWADYTRGMMGRVPDYLNRAMTGYAAGAAFLAEADARFGRNARSYYEHLRENDLCLTHTLIAPQANRAVGAAHQADPFLAARIKEETGAGLVIRGCRMLATLPISDEIMVFPSTLLKHPVDDAPYAFGFAIPNDTPGLRFICRESVDYGRSHYDHPLDAARNLFPRLYPRMVEIIQQIGASGLVAMPTADDVRGALGADIKKYYQAARADAFERIPLFRLAWDTSLSAFGARQVLYERFFFGDPVRMAGALVGGHHAQIQDYAEKVLAFVKLGRDEAFQDATVAE